jgi:hypothetical protein
MRIGGHMKLDLSDYDLRVSVIDYKEIDFSKGSRGGWNEPAYPAEITFQITGLEIEEMPEDMKLAVGDELVIKQEVELEGVKVELDEGVKVVEIKKQDEGWVYFSVWFSVTGYGAMPSQSSAGWTNDL